MALEADEERHDGAEHDDHAHDDVGLAPGECADDDARHGADKGQDPHNNGAAASLVVPSLLV